MERLNLRHKFLNQNKLLKKIALQLGLIFIVVLIAYAQTLAMYFWNDDNAIIFKLQHLNEGMGNLGSGIFGFDSPYRMVIFPLVPVYYLFGINSAAFFAYGIFFYFLAAISVFVFASVLFKNNKLAFLTALVFAAGYVGSESLWRVYNSVHTSITIIYVMLFCSSLFYSTRQKKLSRILLFYSIGLFFYAAAMYWGYVRAHGIFLIALAIELLFNFNWRYSLFRIIPFFYLFQKLYLTGSSNTHHFTLLIKSIFEDYHFELLLVPLKTLRNVFIPDFLNVSIFIFLILLIVVTIKFRSRIITFSLIFIVSNFTTYFVMYNDLVLNSTHRYLTLSLPGAALLIVYLLSRMIKSPPKLYSVTGIYIVLVLILLNWTHLKILRDRSIPTKNFYQTLQSEISILNKNSVLYFDVEDSEKSKNQFKDFFGVGSMPDTTAIAIYFNVDRDDLYLPQTFADFIKTIREKNIKRENIYSFFYSSDKDLINTTNHMRNGLFSNSQQIKLADLNNINLNSSAPFEIDFKGSIQIDYKNIKRNSENKIDPAYIRYLNSKIKYYRFAEATSSSDWKGQEIKFLKDNNPETSWMSNRVKWHYESYDQIIISLKSIRTIGAIRLVFGPTDKAPTRYQYSCSKDNQKWQLINIFYHNPKNHGEEKKDKFDPIDCAYIKMELFNTPRNDAPVIKELEIIDSEFTSLDLEKAKKIEDAPLDFITDANLSLFDNYFLENGFPINFCIQTDRTVLKLCKKISIKMNTPENYSIIFDPQGTVLSNVSIAAPSMLNLNTENFTFKTLPLAQIENE